jgi:hypothetical protein
MPISPMYFNPLSFQQAAPFVTGLQSGTGIASQNIANQGNQLQNQLLAAQTPYAGQMAQAQLATSQQQAPYMQSQTALNQATLPLLQYKFMSPYLSAMAQQSRVAVQNANSLKAYAATPEGQQRLANDPQFRQTYLNAMNNSSGMVNSGYGFTSFPGVPGMGGSSQSMPGANFNPAMQPQSPQANGSEMPSTLPMQTLPQTPQQVQKLQQFFPGSGQQNQQNLNGLKQAASDTYLKQMIPPARLQQTAYENVIEGLMHTNQKTITDAANFAGLAGKANQHADQFAEAAGMGANPQYRNFQTFTNQIAPKMANELRRAFGGQATDSEREAMDDIGNPVAWNKDPQQVFNELNQLRSDLAVNAKEIIKTPSQVVSTAQQNINNPVVFKNNPAPNSSTVKIQGSDGKIWSIPANKLNLALQRGAKQVYG